VTWASQQVRAARDLGGLRVAERAEQLRALGVELGKVAEVLDVEPEALRRYYSLQDELADAA
jgi:hypothetical protein